MNVRSIRFRLTVWYASLLALLLALFGISVYAGLGRYLKRNLQDSLVNEAEQIAATVVAGLDRDNTAYELGEMVVHFAPEINNRFLRLTRADGSSIYLSDNPKDESFDPARIAAFSNPVNAPPWRHERLPNKGELLIFTLAARSRDGSRVFIETGAADLAINAVLHGLLLTLAAGFPFLMGLAIGGGYFLMRRALAPVDQITRSAERITLRNLAERLPMARTGDEIERLSHALNQMIARLDESFQHIRRFTADASHELRTPLTVLRGELEALMRQPELPAAQIAGGKAELREALASTLEETERLSKIVESLLTISRLDSGEAQMELTPFDLADLAATTTEQMRLLAVDKNISLRCEAASPIPILGDRSRVKQVVVNLLDNAIKYTPAGGSVKLSVRAENGAARLEVCDNGIGIPSQALPHVFERFYRVDKARSRPMGGVGLGLPIVRSICTAHGGEITVESTEGEGSRFRVALPLAKTASKEVLNPS